MDDEELKQMILSFRVSELHLLLAFAGRNKVGRKSELQARSIELLPFKSKSIPRKIRELHAALQLQLQNSLLPPVVAEPIAEKPPAMQPHGNRAYAGYPPPQQQVNRGAMYPNLYQQQQQQQQQHHPHQYQPQAKPVVLPSTQYPVHPDVKFKRLPFYDHVGELVKPSSLVPQGNQRQQEGTFLFHLTPAQADAIGCSRDMRPGTRIEYLTQVQLRFCLLETTSEQEDCFPPGVLVKVNSKICPLPNPIPPNKPGVEPKRPPRPVNITPLVKISPVVANSIQVMWTTDYTRGYVVAVHLVSKRTSEDLLNRLKAKGVRAADYTRGMIKDKLKEDGEIATTSLRVSIACPLGKMRMTTPCRASTCNHFQCFDASLFLQMNEKKPQWMCPVCNKPAVYDKLVIDGYFQDVLESTVLPNDCAEIQLYVDGNWEPLVMNKKEQSCVVDKVEIPAVVVKAETVTVAPVKKVEELEKALDPPCVTLSDDDDDMPLVPRKRPISESGIDHPNPYQEAVKSQPQVPLQPTPQQQAPSIITLDEDSPQGSPSAPTAPYNNARPFSNTFLDLATRDVDLNSGYRY